MTDKPDDDAADFDAYSIIDMRLESLRIPLRLAIANYADLAPAAARLLTALNKTDADGDPLRLYLACTLTMGWMKDALATNEVAMASAAALLREDQQDDLDAFGEMIERLQNQGARVPH